MLGIETKWAQSGSPPPQIWKTYEKWWEMVKHHDSVGSCHLISYSIYSLEPNEWHQGRVESRTEMDREETEELDSRLADRSLPFQLPQIRGMSAISGVWTLETTRLQGKSPRDKGLASKSNLGCHPFPVRASGAFLARFRSFSCNILIRLIQLKCKESHGFWWILTDFAYVRWVMDPLKSFNLISFHLIWSGVVLIELALSSHLQILQPRRLALNLWRPAGTRSCTRILDWTCW